MADLGQEGLDLKQRQVVMISQDSFYRNLTDEEREQANIGEHNFDHPGLLSAIAHPLSVYPSLHPSLAPTSRCL